MQHTFHKLQFAYVYICISVTFLFTSNMHFQESHHFYGTFTFTDVFVTNLVLRPIPVVLGNFTVHIAWSSRADGGGPSDFSLCHLRFSTR